MLQRVLPETGSFSHGFSIQSVIPLPAMRATVVQAGHEATGARFFHFCADDTENLFSVSFATPPPDDTGLPHIMEHAVLAGSRKFPVREPFFEMLKMSMATFINAMTGSDITFYPVASNVRRDLFNLADVYMDAVFHPLLSEEVFKREGHHLAPANSDAPLGPLEVSGIVFNEMKGAYSSPDTRLYLTWMKGLMPGTIYARQSGGDPNAIPSLKYDDFVAFHHRHYHPSNAWFFVYGNIPTEDYLAFIDSRLAGFSRGASVSLQEHAAPEPWKAPRETDEFYPAEEPLAAKTYMTLHWLLGSALNREMTVRRYVLDFILLGHDAAPLKKALLDSRLGQDLAHTGVFEVGSQAIFSVGLKGSEIGCAMKFEELVLNTLRQVAEQGLTKAQIAAAFHQAAYHYLEILPMFPIHIMERVLEVWMYGGDPIAFLDMGRALAAEKARCEADPGVFSRMISEELLDNPHRLRSLLRPDTGWAARNEAFWAEHMRIVRSRLDDAGVQKLAEDAAELQRKAGAPNTPEAIAKLPRLSIRDLPAQPRRLPTAVFTNNGVTVLRNDVFSNGVNYLGVFIDFADLPENEWPWVGAYANAFAKLGAAGCSCEQIAERKAACAGGLSCALTIGDSLAPGGRDMRGLLVLCKTLDDQAGPAFELIGDLLLRLEPRNPERLRQLQAQARAATRSELLNNSMHYAMLQAARGLSVPAHFSHRLGGMPNVDFIARLYEKFDQEAEELIQHLELTSRRLQAGCRLTVSFTGSDKAWNAFEPHLRELSGTNPANGNSAAVTPDSAVRREALALPIQVSYCAQALAAPGYLDPAAASFGVGCHLLAFDYMLSEIRLKGNAYGTGASYSPTEGTLHLYSFRDPAITRTLKVFAALPDFARQADWTQEDVDRSIIGIAKNEERPIRPESATLMALRHHLLGLTNEYRDAFYAATLSATPASVKNAIARLDADALRRGSICIASSRENIELANQGIGANKFAIIEPEFPL